MKKIFLRASFILLALSLSACLQVETNVYVNRDGSGEIEETVMLKDEVIDMMKQFILALDSTKTEDLNLFKEEELISNAAKYGEGVSFISSQRLKSQDFEGVKARYSFTDITKINLSLISDDVVPTLSEEQSVKSENELLKFLIEKSPTETRLKIFLPSMRDDSESDVINQEVNDSTLNDEFEKAKMMFTDMKMSLKVVPFDQIKQTNADFVQNNQVTLIEMNMNSLLNKPELFKELSGNKVKSLDDFRKLINSIEGFKVESKNEIQIIF